MSPTRRRGLLVAFVPLALVAAATVAAAAQAPPTIEIAMRYSHFEPAETTVTAGVPVTFVLRNEDPIDHEWIVATEEVHERHRTSTELVHGAIPTEIPVDAGTVRTTTVTFDEPGTMRFICHLPGHEAYGMVGVVRIVGR